MVDDDNASLRQALADTGPLIEARDDEIAELRAKLARVEGENRTLTTALCDVLDYAGWQNPAYRDDIGPALRLLAALDGDAAAGED